MTKWRAQLFLLAELVDAYRVFPRIFLLGYGALCWKVGLWFMVLDKPSAEQSAFVTIIVSVFAPLANWYMQSGRRWQNGEHK